MQATVLQVLADEKCLHLMPPLSLSILDASAYSKPAVAGTNGPERDSNSKSKPDEHQAQHVLQELRQAGLLDKCYQTDSLIKDL